MQLLRISAGKSAPRFSYIFGTIIKNIMFSLALAKKDKITVYDCKQILSYLDWIDCTNTYDMYFNHIKIFVFILRRT